MPPGTPPTVVASPGDGSLSRNGALSFAGAVTSALMGFVLTVVVARTLGTEGAGTVLQAIGIFSIVHVVAQSGLDTTVIWLLPRLVGTEDRSVRGAVVGLLCTAGALGLAAAAALWGIGELFQPARAALGECLQLLAWFVPFAPLMTVALAATRGLGGVRPFVLVGSVGVPVARPVLVLLATFGSTSALAASVAWAAPLPLAAGVGVLIALRLVARHERATGVSGARLPDQALRGRIRTYAVPRVISTTLEQCMIWLDVVLVGILAGPAAAGVYGAASRLVGAGLILNTAMRIVVAPVYSKALGRGDTITVRSLYLTTTTIIVLCSTPIYIFLAAFGSTVLGLLGEGFRDGATSLLILSLALVVVLLTGNIQSLLLMSGRSGLAALNKAVALSVQVTGIVLLVPVLGIEGAALGWAAGMLLDAGLAAYQVQRHTGVRVGGVRIALASAVAVASCGTAAVVGRVLLGDTVEGLLVAVASGAICWGMLTLMLRRRLQITDVRTLLRHREADTE